MKWRFPALAVLAIASGFLARGVSVSSDVTSHFPASAAPWVELSKRFDAFNTLMVGLEEPAAPLLGLAQVKRLTERLTALKANGVLSVASVTNVESIHEGEDGSLETELLVARLPDDKAALDALAARISDDAQVSGSLISRDQLGYLVILRADPRRDAGELARAIRAVVEEEKGSLRATYFGAPFFQAYVFRALPVWLGPLALGLFFAVLAFFVRDLRVIFSTLLLSGVAMVVWLALVRVAGLALIQPMALVVFVLACLSFSRDRRPSLLLAAMAVGSLIAGQPILALAAVAIAAVGGLSSSLQSAPEKWNLRDVRPRHFFLSRNAQASLLLAAGVVALGLVAKNVRFHATPQTIFSPTDDVGTALSFFDRHLGGSDVIQISFRGDLRDPAIAGRLLRLTDLLEGPDAFNDVRAVAPVLGFLSHGFGGVHRIPASRESLNNLWFFLEGRPDVRNLVSEARDEAMVVLRVPSTLPRPIATLTPLIDAAITGSLKQGRASTKLRFTALAQTYALPTTRLDEALDAPLPDVRPAVNAALKKWLTSGDSPFQPTEDQWAQLEPVLDDPAKLATVATRLDAENAAALVSSLTAHLHDLRLNLQAMALVDRVWDRATPPAARMRAQGIFADGLDPHTADGSTAIITVSGLPIVAAQISHDLLAALWRTLAILLVAGGAITRSPRALLEAALATAATLAFSLGVDPSSLPIFLLPPLAAFLVSGGQRIPAAFCLAFGAAAAALLLSGVLPISRIGAALAVGLVAVALMQVVSWRAASSAP